MSGHEEYVTHRAIPIGIPNNAIDKIILDTNNSAVDSTAISAIKEWIDGLGLDIKLFDLFGNPL